MKPSFFALFVAVLFTEPAPAAEDLSTMLLRKTQAFSDAGQRGDGQAMAALLDDRVIFFNEGRDQATKADMAANTPTNK